MRFLKIYLLFAYVGGCLSCRSYRSKIVGGGFVNIDKAPYTVQIRYRGDFGCGATIIHPEWVLTAAHCVYQSTQAKRYKIRSGTSWRGYGTVHRVSKVIVHESFSDKTGDYDIAVMKVQDRFKIGSSSVGKAALPPAGSTPKDGTMAKVSGWGVLFKWLPFVLSLHLRAANVPITNKGVCQKAYSKQKVTITDRMICAGLKKGGSDACYGDSGGPLVAKGVVIGVVSFAYDCGNRHYPGVYAHVGYFRDWIKNVAGI